MATAKADLAARKAWSMVGDHVSAAEEPFKVSVKGSRSLAAPGRNRQ